MHEERSQIVSNPTGRPSSEAEAGARRAGAQAEAPPEQPQGARAPDAGRTSVLRVPTFSPLASLLGWILAWGAIVIATGSLERAGVPAGFGLGIAEGGPGDGGFAAGLWLLLVSGGAFLVGGYAAGRMARAHGTMHGLLVWAIAMLATGGDALIESLRAGGTGVLQLIPGVPYWVDTGLRGRAEAGAALAVFAVVALAGALVGGGLGQAANRRDRTDDALVES